MKPNADHVVCLDTVYAAALLRDHDSKAFAWGCAHCGAEWAFLAHAVPLTVFVAIGKEWVKMHRHCRPKTTP